MTILHEDRLLELLESKELIIESTDERVPFDPALQIVSDTIDLRLHPMGMVYRGDVDCADTLNYDPAELFETITIPLVGYVLQPGEILFASTLEIACIANSDFIGRMSSRGTYSRFGLSVTCGRMRFPSGTPHTPDLQIANHSSKPVRIYPYSFVVQLQIETASGTCQQPYEGMYPKTIGPVPPLLSRRDKSVSELLANLIAQTSVVTPDLDEAAELVDEIDSSMRAARRPLIRIQMLPRARALFGIAFGVFTTLAGGFIVNIISGTTEWTHWKYVGIGFALLLLLLLLAIDIAIIFSSEDE